MSKSIVSELFIVRYYLYRTFSGECMLNNWPSDDLFLVTAFCFNITYCQKLNTGVSKTIQVATNIKKKFSSPYKACMSRKSQVTLLLGLCFLMDFGANSGYDQNKDYVRLFFP